MSQGRVRERRQRCGGEGQGCKARRPLPEALQLWTVYSPAVPVSSNEPTHARAFIAALVSPAMRDRWTAAGWEPAK